MVAGKSACKSGDGKASHVIKAINKNIADTDGSLRFSLGRNTTKKDIDYTIKSLSEILQKLSYFESKFYRSLPLEVEADRTALRLLDFYKKNS